MEQFAQVFLALLAAAIIVRLVKGGWSGPGGARDWLGAKFLNKAPAGR